jgi:hypothetical protein
MAAPAWRNEAESSSLGLRLAGSPHRASPWGLLLSAPVWLHVGHLFDMLFTFQNNREARLGLTHRMDADLLKEETPLSSVLSASSAVKKSKFRTPVDLTSSDF